jgi:hypothetical protein
MTGNREQDDSIHEQFEGELGFQAAPDSDTAPGQISATERDMDRTKPSGDSGGKPHNARAAKAKSPAQQTPQDGSR